MCRRGKGGEGSEEKKKRLPERRRQADDAIAGGANNFIADLPQCYRENIALQHSIVKRKRERAML